MDGIEYLRSIGYTYLVHVSRRENMETLMMESTEKKINTLYERYEKRINPRGVYSINEQDFEKSFEVIRYEYPGIFFHLVTSTMDEMRENFEENNGCVKVIFPLELMLQKNWHYRISDKNGHFDYDTYFPETIKDIPSQKQIKEYYENLGEVYVGNEVIFHDGIWMSNCLGMLGFEYNHPFELKLDLDRKPSYLFYSDRCYDGTELSFYRMDLIEDDIENNKVSDKFYIEFVRKQLPDRLKHLCDNVTNKSEMEYVLFETKIGGMDLITYYYIYREW